MGIFERKKFVFFWGFLGLPISRTFYENPRDRDPKHICITPSYLKTHSHPDEKPRVLLNNKFGEFVYDVFCYENGVKA